MIEIIFTGGTIGSREYPDGSVSVDDSRNYRLIEMYRENGGKEKFSVSEPYRILSENLGLCELEKLLAAVKAAVKKNPEGIIVTHGTDTLQYSAAALSYVFSDVKIPIVLVSANYILSDERSNGYKNFVGALSFIRCKGGTGVFVSYGNRRLPTVIHRGNRLSNPLPYTDAVFSVLNGAYGTVHGEHFFKNKYYSVNKENNNSFLEYSKDLSLKKAEGKVLWIKAHPGMALPEISRDTKAVLLDSYHSGTVNLGALEPVLNSAKKNNIPVFLTGLDSKGTEYKTITEYSKNGIIPLCDRAPIAQYLKLILLIAAELPLVKNMKKAYSEEC